MGLSSIFPSFFFLVFLALFIIEVHVQAQNLIFNVVKYGARPDGISDNTKAFNIAWNKACSSEGGNVVLVPNGLFLVGPLFLNGPCKGPITFHIQGILRAPADASSRDQDHWISFQYVDGLSIYGGGSLDGQGSSAWSYNTCLKDPHCKPLPATMRFDFVTNSTINHITSINSKGSHIILFGCNSFTIHNIKISAPGDSPNTDGINIGNSKNILIFDSEIATGDDCISMSPGSKTINITNIKCGPGHGISVGSLGGIPNEDVVDGVLVTNCNLTGTSNGLRIKTKANPSYPTTVSNLTFQQILVYNVANPIIIDQQYCPSKDCKPGASRVGISDVRFRTITGTTSTRVAVNLLCSSAKPCEEIELRDINIAYDGLPRGPATSSCSNVYGVAYGIQNPPPCIRRSL
ncbi:hypothetical protein Patl1_04043 [Pistacia atlantica]|uniref:Uncharacterized protein n=1 Tax=Pistacia atlantica TaxID=434234 RepID=A0ACC1BTN5_9ROSI|nr:hypothetical protein Patl1_04043 [Pistacia atlantica]